MIYDDPGLVFLEIKYPVVDLNNLSVMQQYIMFVLWYLRVLYLRSFNAIIYNVCLVVPTGTLLVMRAIKILEPLLCIKKKLFLKHIYICTINYKKLIEES